nr:MAG TPA: hypothetical protein [Caudoviricetes sp.]
MGIIDDKFIYIEAIKDILIDCIKESVIVKHSGIKQFTDIDDKPELNNQSVINFNQKCIDKYSKKIAFIITNEAMLAKQSEIIRTLNSNIVKEKRKDILKSRLEFINVQRIMLDQELYKD